jgi:pyruvate,orthophosphate dikinase
MNHDLTFFGPGVELSGTFDVATLGGKGAHLCEMSRDGYPVPEGVIIPTSASTDPEVNVAVLVTAVCEWIESVRAKHGFALFSVRSGAPVSMPGMMDTILNVGLTPSYMTEAAFALGEDCADDCAKRLDEMFHSVVGNAPPKMLKTQIRHAIKAVFASWNNDRAKLYRSMHGIADDMGTAVVIQRMVFGNLDSRSGSGVAFTRHPSTGEREVMGEFLINAQGEDVVAGTATPDNLHDLKSKADFAEVYDEIIATLAKLEEDHRDMQDVEFTVESGKLYLLQTRTGKRTAKAAVKIAVDLVSEGVISSDEAMKRLTGRQFLMARRPMVDPTFTEPATMTGLAACNGVVSGIARTRSDWESGAILIAAETTPDDLSAMVSGIGILTQTGGATSHAAVVARSIDKPCITGIDSLLTKVKSGDKVTIDGSTGNVWVGVDVPVISGDSDEAIAILIEWAMSALSILRRESRVSGPDALVVAADWFTERDVIAKLDEFRDDIKDLDVARVFLDVKMPEPDPEDVDLWSIAADDPFVDMRMKRSAVIGSLVSEPIKGLTLIGVDQFEQAKLILAGYRIARDVDRPSDLIDAKNLNSPIKASGKFLLNCGSAEAAKQVLEALGEGLETIPPSMTLEEAVQNVLKEVAK